MSRSKKKPYSSVVVYNYGCAGAKRFHHHILRNKRKRYLRQLRLDIDAYAPDEGIKKIDGLDIYCFPTDGGNHWYGYFKNTFPDFYRKIIRK